MCCSTPFSNNALMLRQYRRQDVDVESLQSSNAVLETIAKFTVSFTVHRTFGILAQVISDSDGQDIDGVGPVDPGSEVSFNVRITDSTEESGQNTWRLISPGDWTKIPMKRGIYGTWDYTMT